jgi:pimeloyl-ACP methyl ester carboxylesterase
VGLERCGHTVQMDCPEDYNTQVLTFLQGLGGGSQP